MTVAVAITIEPVALPAEVVAMGQRGDQWSTWVHALPATTAALLAGWNLSTAGPAGYGHCSLVLPVRNAVGGAAVLKLGFPDEDSEHEHLALRRWGGNGAVRLLSADPHHRALLLERLGDRDLTSIDDIQACEVVAGLYGRLHVAPLPRVRALAERVGRWTIGLRRLPRSAPLPRRLIEQAIGLADDLTADGSIRDRLLHTDLHYANVLAGSREPWLVIDPKPVNGDPHYELAPMLWNRYAEIAGDVRSGVRNRLHALVDAAGLDEDRARAWVLVRMMHNAMWELEERKINRVWLTRCIAVAKAVQD